MELKGGGVRRESRERAKEGERGEGTGEGREGKQGEREGREERGGKEGQGEGVERARVTGGEGLDTYCTYDIVHIMHVYLYVLCVVYSLCVCVLSCT